MTRFGILTPDGYTEAGSVSQADMIACPLVLIEFEHYRPDGSCRCDEPEERARLMRRYEYTPADFAALDLDDAERLP